MQDALKDINTSQGFEFTSIYSQNDIQIAFPTSMGLPFSYSLTIPTMVHVDGDIKAHTQPDMSRGGNDYIPVPQRANVSLEISAT